MIRFLHVAVPAGPGGETGPFSLEVGGGEAVHLTGPSGCGKSLLVRMACGAVRPSAGAVMVNGLNPAKLSAAGRQGLKRVLACVLDDEPVLAMTAARRVALGLWAAGRPWDAAIRGAREALEASGLGLLARTPLAALARGDRYAVLLAAALARNPHALLVDWRPDDAASAPEPLRARLAAYVEGGGACLFAGPPSGPGALPQVRLVEVRPGTAPAEGA